MTTNAIGRALTGHLSPRRKPGSNDQVEPELVDVLGGAAMLGISPRKFHQLRPQLPAPVVLGVRAVRWKTAELRRYVDSLAAAGARPEPPQLAAARVSKRNIARVGAGAVDPTTGNPESHIHRGVRKRAVPSNSEIDDDCVPGRLGETS